MIGLGSNRKKKKSAHVGLEATVRCRWMPRVAVRRVGNVFISLLLSLRFDRSFCLGLHA